MPLAEVTDLHAVHATTDRVVTTARWHASYCGTSGVLHGGYLMAMADGTGATLAFLNLDEGASTTTVESKTNFFRPVMGGIVSATATIVHKGRTTMAVQTDITSETGALVSRTLQTQAIRRALPEPSTPSELERSGG